MAAYFGDPGSFSHMACGQYFGSDAQLLPETTFRAIFDAVADGEVKYGVFPLENSLTGSIHENYDLLLAYDLQIVGELYLRVIHHLIAKPGTKIEDIRQVWSAAPALQQCRQFLERHPDWDVQPVNTTTSAVHRVRDAGDKTQAAIGSREAAELNRLAVVAEGIETNPRNYTRFVVIAKTARTEGRKTKSSIVFSTPNEPGSLFEVMRIFADHKINMVKLESRPIHGKPWQYMFYADIETDIQAPASRQVLDCIRDKIAFLKILGSY